MTARPNIFRVSVYSTQVRFQLLSSWIQVALRVVIKAMLKSMPNGYRQQAILYKTEAT